jgi:hypothetical protein
VCAALQVFLVDADLPLHFLDGLHVRVASLVRGAGDRKFAHRETEMLDAAALDERQRLERFGAGAQKGDRVRVAEGCEQFAVRVHDRDGTVWTDSTRLPRVVSKRGWTLIIRPRRCARRKCNGAQ